MVLSFTDFPHTPLPPPPPLVITSPHLRNSTLLPTINGRSPRAVYLPFPSFHPSVPSRSQHTPSLPLFSAPHITSLRTRIRFSNALHYRHHYSFSLSLWIHTSQMHIFHHSASCTVHHTHTLLSFVFGGSRVGLALLVVDPQKALELVTCLSTSYTLHALSVIVGCRPSSSVLVPWHLSIASPGSSRHP
ncbi:hypothetical protein FA13DRAFT_1449835 [Coprinellus micaceus]|uniref:Uncharacterized protein n=1 Tax=Coprinellus micaceus TaxID=71717 RepID=A0A4Y7TNT7_COPMI|nr:hypothetical protein FA13DRAFT_1449835 [Coprinellus micaceus]